MNITRCPDFRDYYLNFKRATKFTFIIFIVLFVVLLIAILNETTTDYNNLKIEYDNLTQINLELCDINNVLMFDNDRLNTEIIKLKEENAELQNRNLVSAKNNKNINFLPNNTSSALPSDSNYGNKKTYMYYTSITNTSSVQWQLQQKAITNSYGVRTINEDDKEYACVAIGTGWGYGVGSKIFVKTINGGFYAIIGDIKANAHTNNTNLIGNDGSIVEFIVDKNLNTQAKKMGNINVIDIYSGDVLDIIKVG